jgi:hypothetical protein
MEEEGRMKTYRSAMINVVANGFIIEIGCQKLVASNPEQLKKLVCDYLDDPYRTEKSIMRDHLNGSRPEPVAYAPSVTATEARLAGPMEELSVESSARRR